jgi:hypothetical protein
MDWSPKGMPMIVRHKPIPPKMYPSPERKPPKINQIILPNKVIVVVPFE